MLWCRGKRQALCCDVGNREGYYAVVYVVSPRIGYGLLAAKCILASAGRLQAYSQDFLMVAELIHTVRFSSWLQN
jgi:hypothetical protein